MGQQYSKEWISWTCHFSGGSIAYLSIFFITFLKMLKKPIQISKEICVESQALNYSTNLISNINAIISSIAACSIFYYRFWNDKNIAVRENVPLFIFYSWSYLLSYFFADALSHIIVIAAYYKKIKSKKLGIIGHHIFLILLFLLPQIPKPVHLWLLYNIALFAEFSTIFLNFKWFAKYYHWSNKAILLINYGFVVSWFTFRMVAVIATIILLITYWKQINDEMNVTKVVFVVAIILTNTVLQTYWSSKIIYNIYRNRIGSRTKRNMVHGQTIEFHNPKETDNI